MRTPSRRRLATAVLASATLLIAACGGSDDDGAGDTSTTPSGGTTAATGGATSTDATDGADAAAAPSGTIRVGTYLDAMGLDPHTSTQGQPYIQYVQPVYDTLLRRNPDFTFSPMLATSWEYTDAAKKVLEVELREGVTFSDGTPFDAEAVKVNLERVQEKASGYSKYIADIASIDVVDPTTVVLNLANASPVIELGLSGPSGMMISPAAFENPDLDANPVGTGPYTFDTAAYVDGSTWAYDFREDYWDPDFVGPARLELSLITDPEARFNAIRTGQLDIAAGALEQIPDAEASGLQVLTGDVDWLGLILMDRDGTQVPALGDVRVRQALNFAVDRQAIVDTVFAGNGKVTDQIWPESSPGYLAELEDAYPYDPDRARELLAEAGYADGLTINTPSVGTLNTYVEAIGGYLADVGVTLEITSLESGFVAAVLGGEYDAPLMSFGVEHPHVDTANLLLPDAPFNPFHTDDPEIAQLWTDAASKSPEEAAADYQAINRIITDDAWFLITHRSDLVYFTTEAISGFELYAQQAAPGIYGWQIDV